ncbi:hypothetical protein [Nocardia sp. NPDC004860]|uniref:hypothetical protein n=1 Tax=Nocardia sp. NPDC004860 TaxID=3154557 RepID=UPI0033A494AA
MAEGQKTPGRKAVGRKSLGPRNETKLRYPKELDLQDLAKARGYSNVNQFVSDVLCLLAGRPDLATTKAYQGTLNLKELAQAS